MKRSLITAITAALAVAGLALVAPAANAAPAPTTTEVQAVAPIQLSTPNSGALRVVKDVSQLPAGGVTYVVGSGSIVAVVPQSTGVDASPLFSVGIGWGVYLYLNRVDQGAISTGGAAGLAILICAIPAVNVFGCAAVVAVLATAAFYIAAYGICPSQMEIQIPGGSAKCVR